MLYLFIFFLVSHLAAFLLGMWLSVVANGMTVKRKGMCSCAPGSDTFTYKVLHNND